ncbi:hypothetical protein A9K97_gp124 [Tokyovirus A1]|uniref:hypothetical protein n=1 Tax=Tokyovirus A1 TaxID=1826170 RepID=UPI0007A96CFA|nr:hypothetical protein A9K97_gp124 [Tokyovirus A1]BAU80227.1 hypothetical protein [Tokyovirus A1]
MSKLAESLSYGDDVHEEHHHEVFQMLSRSFEDEYEKISAIETRLKETCKEMYFPTVFSRQNIGLFLFLSEYKK